MLFHALPSGMKLVLGCVIRVVNAIWCAVGSPAPDYSYDGVGKSCLSYSFPSAKWAPASTFGFTDMGTVPGPDGDAESIFNQF